MPSSDSGPKRRTLSLPSLDTVSRWARSLDPNQSASRQERRNGGHPSATTFRRMSSKGVSPSGEPARFSSSPSMNRVTSRHARMSSMSNARKSRADTQRQPSRLPSSSKRVVFPPPGGASSTYTSHSRKSSSVRESLPPVPRPSSASTLIQSVESSSVSTSLQPKSSSGHNSTPDGRTVFADFGNRARHQVGHGPSSHSRAGIDRNSDRGMPPSPARMVAEPRYCSLKCSSPLNRVRRAPLLTSTAESRGPRARTKSTSRFGFRQ